MGVDVGGRGATVGAAFCATLGVGVGGIVVAVGSAVGANVGEGGAVDVGIAITVGWAT